MFACQVCGREYSNRNSLTRHAHNHKTKQHSCSICGTIFYRRDLLSRHSKMHEQQDGPASTTSASEKPLGSRKRCHTACGECRNARIKCNGQMPCSACETSGKRCGYGSKSHRISQGPVIMAEKQIMKRPSKRSRISDTEPKDEGGSGVAPNERSNNVVDASPGVIEVPGPDDVNNHPSDNHPSEVTVPRPSEPPSSCTDWTNSMTDAFTSNVFALPPQVDCPSFSHNSFDPMGVAWTDPMADMTTWPWLHEAMFLYNANAPLWPTFDECNTRIAVSTSQGVAGREAAPVDVYDRFNHIANSSNELPEIEESPVLVDGARLQGSSENTVSLRLQQDETQTVNGKFPH
jgi:hypothetical protein